MGAIQNRKLITITQTDKTIKIKGILDPQNAVAIRSQVEQLIAAQTRHGKAAALCLDVDQLQANSTLPLALLMRWLKTGQEANVRLQLKNIPHWLDNLIAMHNLHSLFKRSDAKR